MRRLDGERTPSRFIIFDWRALFDLYEKLPIRVKTVESHQASITEKLALENGRELAFHATRRWDGEGRT